jgi:hypothetical protein
MSGIAVQERLARMSSIASTREADNGSSAEIGDSAEQAKSRDDVDSSDYIESLSM